MTQDKDDDQTIVRGANIEANLQLKRSKGKKVFETSFYAVSFCTYDSFLYKNITFCNLSSSTLARGSGFFFDQVTYFLSFLFHIRAEQVPDAGAALQFIPA